MTKDYSAVLKLLVKFRTEMPVNSVDDVISSLTVIIDQGRTTGSRIAYFAGLYRRVTRALKQKLQANQFQNPAVMEQLCVAFGNRYLNALTAFESKNQISRCWHITFEAATNNSLLVLEHLTAAINAHVGFDLALGIAQVATPATIGSFRNDFVNFNALLANQTDQVAEELAQVSPVIRALERLGLRDETSFVDFSLAVARDLAWDRAVRYCSSDAEELKRLSDQVDSEVELVGRAILQPVPPASLLLEPLRILEIQDVGKVIDILSG